MLPQETLDIPPGKLVSVTTYLQMFKRPPAKDDPPGSWSVVRVNNPDAGWYRDIYRRVGEHWLWQIRESDEDLRARLRGSLLEVHVLHTDGQDEGLLVLDFQQEGECELSSFGLTQRLIGKGAGRWLMNRALELVWSRPIKRFWLHTRNLDHPNALEFYVRSGFVPYRRQARIITDRRATGDAPHTAAPHVPLLVPGLSP